MYDTPELAATCTEHQASAYTLCLADWSIRQMAGFLVQEQKHLTMRRSMQCTVSIFPHEACAARFIGQEQAPDHSPASA